MGNYSTGHEPKNNIVSTSSRLLSKPWIKIAIGYYLFIVPCPKRTIIGTPDRVCNEHCSLQQIPNLFGDEAI